MHRLWPVAAVVLAAAVFAAAGYLLEQHNSVPQAGQVLGYSPPPSSPPTVPASPTKTRSSSAAKPVVAFLGDDYTAGTRASAPTKRFSTLLCTALQLSERNFGVPHTGYADTRGGGDYRSRVARVIAAKPDAVVVSGGRNDVIDDPDTLAANARELFTELRRRLPRAKIIASARSGATARRDPCSRRSPSRSAKRCGRSAAATSRSRTPCAGTRVGWLTWLTRTTRVTPRLRGPSRDDSAHSCARRTDGRFERKTSLSEGTREATAGQRPPQIGHPNLALRSLERQMRAHAFAGSGWDPPSCMRVSLSRVGRLDDTGHSIGGRS